VYVADQGDGDMSLVDTHPNRIVAVVPVRAHPYRLAASPGR
jgi:YVTN family beta-propeller protein